jgi:hypothetical protein
MGSKKKSQPIEDRRAAGRRQIAIWLTLDQAADLDALGERWGIIGPRDIIATALRRCATTEENDG